MLLCGTDGSRKKTLMFLSKSLADFTWLSPVG